MNNWKETSIKNEDFDLDNISKDEKSYKNLSVYNTSYKTFTTAKPLRIRFDKIGGFIRFYDETRHFAFFGSEKHDLIYNRIKYLIVVKSGIICYFSKLCKDQSRFKRFFSSRKRRTF